MGALAHCSDSNKEYANIYFNILNIQIIDITLLLYRYYYYYSGKYLLKTVNENVVLVNNCIYGYTYLKGVEYTPKNKP